MAAANRQIRLVARPGAAGVDVDCFAIEAAERPQPGANELLIRVIYLSIDPAMRGWIAEAPNYRDPVPLGAVMPGFTLGEIVASNHPDFATGELVYGRQGWREWAISDGTDIVRRADPAHGPLPLNLSLLGLTGVTAYLGLMEIGKPKEGETVVVSTAAGAVGSTVGQIAKMLGCHTVGLTGHADKVGLCVSEFGYDAAINYKAVDDLPRTIHNAAPHGVDIYFDNTGGAIADAVVENLNVGARMVICGTIAQPSDPTPEGPRWNRQFLIKRARMEGFLVLDHIERFREAAAQLADWYRDGKINSREEIVDGLENAPEALMRLLRGANHGKMMVRVGPEPLAEPRSGG
ncbi:MAG: NADP-dependent oxidoreductase [Rhodospirillaceae bacterium]|nr:NADP-dependent oxidoreductase [Rhodospirillaceae bacterium]